MILKLGVYTLEESTISGYRFWIWLSWDYIKMRLDSGSIQPRATEFESGSPEIKIEIELG